MRLLAALLLPLLMNCLPAQERESGAPRWRIGFGLAGGNFDVETDRSGLDGDTDAGLFRLHFEGTSARGIGGGARFEGIGVDDDLFDRVGAPGTEARQSSLFGHFTYRVESHRFAMPLRVGLLLDGLTFEEQNGNETLFASLGPYLEVAPEVVLVRGRKVAWSLYGEFGFGIAATAIDIDGDSNDYRSATGYAGIEFGTRLHAGPVELGLAFLGRYRSMDESDPENGLVVLGNDTAFRGVVFTCSFLF